MSRRVLVLLSLLVACRAGTNLDVGPATPPPVVDTPIGDADGPAAAAITYPASERIDHVDDYHGTKVPDPYRWLEDMESEATRKWIGAQNDVTFAHLGTIPARKAIGERLKQLWNFERWSVPAREGKHLVVGKNDGLQNQNVLYVLDDAGQERVLLDPNTLSKDGTVALAGTVYTHDGSKVAYGLSASGSDWQVWKVRDVATGTDATDELKWIKFNEPTWAKDGRGFYYARYDEPKPGEELANLNFDQKVYWHELGTPQSADSLVYARPDHKEWGFDPEVTEDGRWLVITVRIGTDPKTSVFVQAAKRTAKKPAKTIEVLPGFTARFKVVGSQGDTLWLLTDDGAPRGRLVAVDITKPGKAHWKTLIPESMRTLTDVKVVADRFVATWLEDAQSKVSIHALTGVPERELALPGIGTVGGFTGKRSDKDTFFSFTSFATPTEIWKLDPASGKTESWKRPKVAFDPNDYETRQVFYESKDGTKVPMFVSHKKGLAKDGKNPTYLFGYGGFNVSLTPSFSVANLVWMEMGGIYAVPNLRGGGEYGEEWHAAGTKLAKQNVFDDFIAAAEFLVKEKYTSTPKLAIGGRSNGGLLVGAVLTQRPDLFGAALPGVGVMDMLRFDDFTIGWAWRSDYGSPDDPKEFQALLAYSPYHNTKPGTAYPPTLVYTADHDDRVVPAHSYKFIAALQHAQRSSAPVLIRIDTKSGHGAGKPTTKQIEEWADLWGFLAHHLDVRAPS